MNETLWHYEEGGRPNGPVGERALRELIRSGRLGPDARVWRSGMAGWQRWREIPSLAAEAAPAGAPAATVAVGGRPPLEEVDLSVLVVLSIVTFGIYGLVRFYQAGEGYARLAPERRSTFETLFWVFVACALLSSSAWFVAAPLGFAGTVGGFVVGILLLNEVLAARAALVRSSGVSVALMSDTAHRVLWILGSLLSWAVLGLVLLVVQGFKFFDDHNQLARALRARTGTPAEPPPPAPAASAPPSAPAAPSSGTPGAGAAPATAEALPAERACIRCSAPLGPADRFCSSCGAAV